MSWIDNVMMRVFPSLYRGKMFNDISRVGYVSLEDYKQDIIDINRELDEVEVTIDYYKERRDLLMEWKHCVEVKINKWNEEDSCLYCRFFNKNYCSKFESNVDSSATCREFEWR